MFSLFTTDLCLLTSYWAARWEHQVSLQPQTARQNTFAVCQCVIRSREHSILSLVDLLTPVTYSVHTCMTLCVAVHKHDSWTQCCSTCYGMLSSVDLRIPCLTSTCHVPYSIFAWYICIWRCSCLFCSDEQAVSKVLPKDQRTNQGLYSQIVMVRQNGVARSGNQTNGLVCD